MSGSITVGGKILASHDNVSGKLSMSGDVDLANVDMSNMVFPAGHILQVKNRGYYGYYTSISFSVTGATQQLVGGLSISFVPMKENSNFIIEMSGPLMTGGVARGSSLLYVKNSQTPLDSDNFDNTNNYLDDTNQIDSDNFSVTLYSTSGWTFLGSFFYRTANLGIATTKSIFVENSKIPSYSSGDTLQFAPTIGNDTAGYTTTFTISGNGSGDAPSITIYEIQA
jgi:hypothetical protein